MRLVSLADGTRDGRLHILSTDGTRLVAAEGVKTMQDALERWDAGQQGWLAQAAALDADTTLGMAFDPAEALAPLPRAWQWLDGSAFATHTRLFQKAWSLPETGLPDRPLMYQGLSDRFLPPISTATFPSAADGIDFEGEFGVLLGDVPMGTSARDASQYIRMIVLLNDWSLRALGPVEMATGFGWLQCKPACAVAPVAVTPDELGEAWRNARVCLPLNIALNGEAFGRANGEEMKFGFDELIAHAAYSRALPAGTILGSGTVANENYAEVGSSCIVERRMIDKLAGREEISFMDHGDEVTMSAAAPDGRDLFGPIRQTVAIAGA